ncbi:MAG TPA: VanZ family protein [Solirubrobacterales bacterium]|nr:VanZ family protein [Solirubrobacterales bacterium]
MPAANRQTAVRSLGPLGLMALIFWLSSQSDLGTELGVIDLIGRKIGHAGVYGLLTLLWWWALAPVAAHRPRLIAAAVIALLYGASDEYHQTFIAGRVGSPIDVAIDAVGVAATCWLLTGGRSRRLTAWLRTRLGR